MMTWMIAMGVLCATLGAEEPRGVSGSVVLGGKPVAGVIVSVSGSRLASDNVWLEPHRDVAVWTTTGEDGRFTLDVSGEALSLFANFLGPDGTWASEQLPGSGEAAKPIELSPAKTIETAYACSIRVVDAEHRPVAGALVVPTKYIYGQGGGWSGDLPCFARHTDAKGETIVGMPTPREHAHTKPIGLGVRVIAPGYAHADLPSVLFDDGVNEIVVREGVRIVGAIKGSDGPMVGAWVNLVPADLSGERLMAHQRALTDATGAFVFEHVPADSAVWISCAPWDNASGEVAGPVTLTTLKNGEIQDIGTIFAGKGRRVGGKVVCDKGVTLPTNTWVTLSHEKGWLGWAVPLGENNSFMFEGVPNGGPYRFIVCAPGRMLSLDNAAASRIYPTGMRAMITRDHTDLEVLVINEVADREDLQPRTKPLRGVEGDRGQ